METTNIAKTTCSIIKDDNPFSDNSIITLVPRTDYINLTTGFGAIGSIGFGTNNGNGNR